jgi:hypothetical protein
MMDSRIVIEPAANGVILEAGTVRKVFVLDTGSRSRAIHDLLREVAASVGEDLDVVVQVTDPRGVERAVATRSAKRELREDDVADEYGVPVKTLQQWRRLATGPAYAKVGKSVYYGRADLDAFFSRHRIKTTGGA